MRPAADLERKERAQLWGCRIRNLLGGTAPLGPGNAMNYTADPGGVKFSGRPSSRRSSVKISYLDDGLFGLSICYLRENYVVRLKLVSAPTQNTFGHIRKGAS
jgi:hypothetical protein